MSEPKSTQYWATLDARELVKKLDQDRRQWLDQSISSGIFAGYVSAYWRNTVAYYSNMLGTSSWETSLEFGGRKGELIKMKIPRARTLIRQFVTLTTKQRLAYEALVDVSEANPQQTAKLAKNLCKHMHEKNNLDMKIESAAELTATVGLSFISTLWRTDRGSEYLPLDKGMLFTGEATMGVHDISEVMWDWTLTDWQDVSYVVLRLKRNRWDLIARIEADQNKSPEQKKRLIDKIRAMPSAEAERRIWNNLTYVTGMNNDDVVYVNCFIHKPSPALTKGRVVEFGDADCIIEDMRWNPYGCIPVEPVVFERIKDTSLGYPLLSSLLPAQEMFDHSFSVTASNQSAFGLQSLLNPRGNKMKIEDIEGMRVVHYTPSGAEGGGKPEPLEFPSTPAEVMQFADRLANELGEISMLNATLRGQPPPNVTSGAMAATLSANALEFLNGAQKALVIAVERSMNHGCQAYKNLASVEQIVDITGESTFAYTKKFKAQDLGGLRKIYIRTQSALMNTTSGRMQLGESLMDRQLLKDPLLLIQLINGAPPETLFKSTWTENIAVQSEVDALLEGQNVFPLETDNHPLYIAAYKEILDNPIIREKTELPQIIVPLLKQRMQMELSMDPTLKALLRGQPLPPPQAPSNSKSNPSDAMTKEAESGAAAPAQPAEPMPVM